SYATTIIYMSALFMEKVSIIHDYMTWGYYCVFGLSFLLCDAIINKKFLKLIYLIPLLGITFINGPKGALIVIVALVMICFYKVTNSWFKRIIMSIIIAILAVNFVDLLKLLIETLENISFTPNSYFINSLKSFISDDKLSGVFDNRDFIYEYSMTTIKENIFGVGIGTFQSIYQVFPHNIFLDIFSTYGVLVGGLIVIFLLYEIITCYIVVKNKWQLIIFIVVLSNSFKLLVSKTFVYDPVFWLLICIIVVIKGTKNRSNNMDT
ncbi:O-antigen ligase family protein, partial [Bacillus nitratireducens]|uniref:O-antigen ligase family protein n=1 Tax=Bacillus nitratireducens TaxID=2026193 RepID=UPI00300B798E